MSLPTKTDLLTLNYSWLGEPFVHVPTKTQDLSTLDYSWLGEPFVANPASTVPPPTISYKNNQQMGCGL